MSTARDTIAGLLRVEFTGRADVDVVGYARQIDAPARSTVMVRVDEVRPSRIPSAWRDYDVALVVIAAATAVEAGEDELDAALEDVLHALDSSTSLTWTAAKRAVYADTNPAYEVALTVTVNKEESTP